MILALSFAAGVFAQAMAAAHMNMPMPMSGAAGEPMPDCDHGDADETTACLIACTPPLLNAVSPELAFRPLVKGAVQALVIPTIIGQSPPPDPHPPRLARLT